MQPHQIAARMSRAEIQKGIQEYVNVLKQVGTDNPITIMRKLEALFAKSEIPAAFGSEALYKLPLSIRRQAGELLDRALFNKGVF